MGGIHSHGNTNVSKISILLGVFFVALFIVVWNSLETIKVIETTTDANMRFIDSIINSI